MVLTFDGSRFLILYMVPGSPRTGSPCSKARVWLLKATFCPTHKGIDLDVFLFTCQVPRTICCAATLRDAVQRIRLTLSFSTTPYNLVVHGLFVSWPPSLTPPFEFFTRSSFQLQAWPDVRSPPSVPLATSAPSALLQATTLPGAVAPAMAVPSEQLCEEPCGNFGRFSHFPRAAAGSYQEQVGFMKLCLGPMVNMLTPTCRPHPRAVLLSLSLAAFSLRVLAVLTWLCNWYSFTFGIQRMRTTVCSLRAGKNHLPLICILWRGAASTLLSHPSAGTTSR